MMQYMNCYTQYKSVVKTTMMLWRQKNITLWYMTFRPRGLYAQQSVLKLRGGWGGDPPVHLSEAIVGCQLKQD